MVSGAYPDKGLPVWSAVEEAASQDDETGLQAAKHQRTKTQPPPHQSA